MAHRGGRTTVTDETEERVDDHERACRDPYAEETDAETHRVRTWVDSLFDW